MAATLASLWDRKKKAQPNIVSPSVDLVIDKQHINSTSPTLATASRSGSAPSSFHNSEQPANGNKPSGSGQDRKRKRLDLTPEQTQILEALYSSSSCSNPSSEEINVAVSRAKLSEQLVKDLLDQNRKSKAQKATDHAETAKPTAQADAIGGRSMKHGTGAIATSPANDPSATLGPQDVAHDKSQQLLRQLDVRQQAAETLTEVISEAAGNTLSAGSQRPEQPQCKQSTRPHMLEPYQKELQSCQQQAKAVEPMTALPHFTDGQLSRPEVAAWLVGNALPLTKAVQRLWQKLQAQDVSSSQTEASLRNCVIDLATRKSFGVKGGASHVADPLEDEHEEHVWRWELRDAKVLPKAQRQQAQAIKKTLLKAQELITALHNACQQLASTATGKAAETRLQKALDKLQKLQQNPVETTAASAAAAQLPTGPAQPVEAPIGTGQQAAGTEQKVATDQKVAGPHQKEHVVVVTAGEVMAEGASGQGLSATTLAEPSQANGKPASSMADMAMTPVEDQEAGSANENTAPLQGQGASCQQPSGDEQTDKVILLAEKKAQKEEAKSRKEAERDKAKAEKEAQKEQQRLAKEAEKEQLRAEKEAEKEKAKQEKEAARKEKEAQKEADKGKQAAGFGSERVLKKSQNVFKSFFSARKPEAVANEEGAILSPPPSIKLNLADATSNQEIEQQLADPWSDTQVWEAFQQTLAGWKAKTRPKRMTGLPPSWACKANAVEQVQQSLQERYGQDYRPDALRTWRKKLLWHSSKHNSQESGPAYYGSWSKPAQLIKARRWNVEEPGLDYEVESDEDWFEPEDGESLTDVEDSEMEEDEESQADGFVVDDGYLSAGEGGPIDNDDFGAEVEEEVQSVLAASGAPLVERYTHQHSMLMLEAALEKARRSHRPLIITSLPGPSDDPTQIHMDPSLLAALDMQVLDARVAVTMPPAPEEAEAPDSPKHRQNPSGSAAKVPAKESMEQLVPDLITFLLTHPDIKSLKQVITGFIEAHADRRITKKWLHAKVKDIAQREKGCWVIKPQALPHAGIESAEAVKPTSQQEQPTVTASQADKPATRIVSASASGPAAATAVPFAPAAAPAASVSTMHRFLRKASGSPVRKGTSTTAPACPASVKPRPSSPGVVDLCVSPLQQPRARSSNAATTAADSRGDKANEVEMVDASQSPVREAQPVKSRTAGAAVGHAKGVDKPKLGLAMTGPMSGTADPYWQRLSDLVVQGSVASQHADELKEVFTLEANLDKWQGRVPSYLLSALVKALGCSGLAAPVRTACADCAFKIVRSLASAATGSTEQKSPLSEVWSNNRASPPAATLTVVCADPLLMSGLQDCLKLATHNNDRLAHSAARLLCGLLEVGVFDSSSNCSAQAAVENKGDSVDLQAASTFRCKLAGNQDWRQVVLDGVQSRDKHLLAAYLCASLYHVIKDPQSRQLVFADHEAQAAVIAALLGAAHNTDTLGVAKYGMKAVLTLVQVSQQDHASPGAKSSSGGLLESAWEIAYSRVVDGIDTFGEKQQTIKLLALQVCPCFYCHQDQMLITQAQL
ncbi:TPA: hypothetical protein ACH3X1_014721 [Trebouxia sp. C0004]